MLSGSAFGEAGNRVVIEQFLTGEEASFIAMVDGKNISLPDTLGYRGMMLSDVPNFALAAGYTNASWTLKCDLTSKYVCRLLKHMDKHGYHYCVPRNNDPELQRVDFLDLASGYVERAIDKFPKQGHKSPWRLYQNYLWDIISLRFSAMRDKALEYGRMKT